MSKRENEEFEEDLGVSKKMKSHDTKSSSVHEATSVLHQAILLNDLQAIKAELEKGEKLCSGDGMNCYYLAHKTKNWPLVEKLLDLDPSGIKSRGPNGKSLLILYLKYISDCISKLKIIDEESLGRTFKELDPNPYIQKLIACGIDLEARDASGKTAIMFAVSCWYPNFDVATQLLENKVNIQASDCNNMTVLMYAIMHNHNNNENLMARKLLEMGADVSCLNNFERSALLLACSYRNPEEVSILLKFGANPLVQDITGKTPLMAAALNPNCSGILVKLLLEAGADVTARDKQGETALFYSRNPETTTILLQANSDPSSQNHKGESFLLKCCLKNRIELIQVLLQYGANPCLQNNKGVSPFMIVCQYENIETIKMFLTANINLTSQDNKGFSAIHYLHHKNLKLFELLLEHGANASAKDACDFSLLMHHSGNHHRCLKFLEVLKKYNADVSVQDSLGKTALMYAVTEEHIECVKLLLDRDVVNVQDEQGMTALMIAIVMDSRGVAGKPNSEVKFTSLLLDAGADVLAQTHRGDTPLTMAATFNNFKIVDLLVNAGANIEIKNGFSMLPVQYLISNHVSGFLNKDDLVMPTIKKLLVNANDPFKISIYWILKCYLEELTHDGTFHVDYSTRTLYVHIFKYILEIFTSKKIDVPVGENLDAHKYCIEKLLDKTPLSALKELFEMVIESPFKDVRMTTTTEYFHIISDYENTLFVTEITYDTISVVIHASACDMEFSKFNLNQVMSCLEVLFENGFSISPTENVIISPLSVLADIIVFDGKHQHLLPLAQELIARGANVTQRLIRFRDEKWNTLGRDLKLPDALWLAAFSGKHILLHLLVPYWSPPPLALLMFMPTADSVLLGSYQPKLLNKCIKNSMNSLAQIGGPLPPGSEYIRQIGDCLSALAQRFEFFTDTLEDFRQLHSVVPSLKNMCRCVIRGCVSTSNDLPERLFSLPVAPGLRPFLNLTEY